MSPIITEIIEQPTKVNEGAEDMPTTPRHDDQDAADAIETPGKEATSPGEQSTHVDATSPGEEEDKVDADEQQAAGPVVEEGQDVEDEEKTASDDGRSSDVLPAIPLDNSADGDAADHDDRKWKNWSDDEEAGWKRGASKWNNNGRGNRSWQNDNDKWKKNENGRWVEDKDEQAGDASKERKWKKDENGKWVEITDITDEKTYWIKDKNGKWVEINNEGYDKERNDPWKSTMEEREMVEEKKESKEEREKRRQEEAAKFADPTVIAELEKEHALVLSRVVDEKRKFQEKFEQLSRVIQAAEVRQKDMNLAGHNLIHQLKAALEDFDKADKGEGGALEEALKAIPGGNLQAEEPAAPAGFEWRRVEKVNIASRGPPLPSQEEIYAQAVNFGQVRSSSDLRHGLATGVVEVEEATTVDRVASHLNGPK
ncbi:hypothetical protein FOL47_001276 [Perkinsus chesapeaki]|uniref:Uncharacterized protein n=1 Tax=Perkinsus chesapeaki TaxID=330153 RepID=A0A7J6N3F0_PERCH|nr:hypothetical protein FOL47_001276 [Perkinsus chesapeaki]